MFVTDNNIQQLLLALPVPATTTPIITALKETRVLKTTRFIKIWFLGLKQDFSTDPAGCGGGGGDGDGDSDDDDDYDDDYDYDYDYYNNNYTTASQQ